MWGQQRQQSTPKGRSKGGYNSGAYQGGRTNRSGWIGTNQPKQTKQFDGIPAVSQEKIKCRSWLRSYPDSKKIFCSIVDFGKGAKVFQPSDLSKHLDTNRSEFKRH